MSGALATADLAARSDARRSPRQRRRGPGWPASNRNKPPCALACNWEQYFRPTPRRQAGRSPRIARGARHRHQRPLLRHSWLQPNHAKARPARTVESISDVMGVLSQCVLDSEGVVVDYIGDELMAISGAPEDQPDHATRACRTALAMFASLPRLNERWQPMLKEPLGLSIGINSGNAQVGNVGSKIELSYRRPWQYRQPRQPSPRSDQASQDFDPHHRRHQASPRRTLRNPTAVPGARRQYCTTSDALRIDPSKQRLLDRPEARLRACPRRIHAGQIS